MSSFSLSPNSDSTNLAIPKLRDDGSNWVDYEPRIHKAMGAKGLWRHVEGKALEPKHYATDTNGVYVLVDGKTPATNEQVESKEAKIEDFEKKHYLAQHIILSTTSTRLSSKIKNMKTAHEMWNAVKADVTTRSTLYLIDAENQLEGMRLNDSSDPKTTRLNSSHGSISYAVFCLKKKTNPIHHPSSHKNSSAPPLVSPSFASA